MEEGHPVRRGILLAILLTLTPLGEAVAALPPAPPVRATLRPSDGCTPQHVACLTLVLNLAPLNDKLRIRTGPDARIYQTAFVRGRLNGGRLAWYQLETASDQSGPLAVFVAYMGRSARNRPLIATDQGIFELTTQGLYVGTAAYLSVVDEKLHRVVGHYENSWSPDDNWTPYVVTKTGEIGIWDRERDLCISAPQEKPGLLREMTKQCRAAGLPEEGRNVMIGGNVVTLQHVPRRIRALVRDNDTHVFFRIPGTTLVIALVKPCTECG
jgi:hypothetical protein